MNWFAFVVLVSVSISVWCRGFLLFLGLFPARVIVVLGVLVGVVVVVSSADVVGLPTFDWFQLVVRRTRPCARIPDTNLLGREFIFGRKHERECQILAFAFC